MGQGSRLADVVQEKKVGRSLRAEAKKAVDEIDARFQGFWWMFARSARRWVDALGCG